MQPDTIIPDPSNPQSWNRYSYVTNRPVNFNDPTGHVEACDHDDWACQYHWDEPVTDDSDKYEVKLTKKQKKVVEFLLNSSEFVVSAAVEPIDWILTIDYCTKGECSPWMLLGLLPIIPSSMGKQTDEVGEFIYKSSTGSPKSLTPRPGIDDLNLETGGLSFFDDPRRLDLDVGDKYVVVDPKKINGLEVLYDNTPPGHVSVRPSTLEALKDWALARNTGGSHPFTDIILNAIVDIRKK